MRRLALVSSLFLLGQLMGSLRSRRLRSLVYVSCTRRSRLLLGLVLQSTAAGVVSLPALAQAPVSPPGTPEFRAEPADGRVLMDFSEPTPIVTVARWVARATGRNVVLGAGVSGTISIVSGSRMTKEQAWDTFVAALESSGFKVAPAGPVWKVERARGASAGGG